MNDGERIDGDGRISSAASGGVPEQEPSSAALYHCDECGLQVPAEKVRWSKDQRALCPRCEWPLDKVG